MKIFVYYHLDADGKCAGHVVSDYVNSHRNEFVGFEGFEWRKINSNTVDMIYHDVDNIHEDDLIYIVDFSFTPLVMDNFLTFPGVRLENIVWIDHHRTAIEAYKDYPFEFNGLRSTKFSGCVLTWMYFNHVDPDEPVNPHTELHVKKQSLIDRIIGRKPEVTHKLGYYDCPYYIRLVGDYDTWTFQYGKETAMAFNKMSYMCMSEPWSVWWHQCDDSLYMENMIREGKVLLEYDAKQAEGLCKNKGFYRVFHGYRAFCLNKSISSTDFESITDDSIDIFIGFNYDGKAWNYQLRTRRPDINVGELAKEIDPAGGGHVAAAGFRSDEFLLEVNS